jgi:hypothetical protein
MNAVEEFDELASMLRLRLPDHGHFHGANATFVLFVLFCARRWRVAPLAAAGNEGYLLNVDERRALSRGLRVILHHGPEWLKSGLGPRHEALAQHLYNAIGTLHRRILATDGWEIQTPLFWVPTNRPLRPREYEYVRTAAILCLMRELRGFTKKARFVAMLLTAAGLMPRQAGKRRSTDRSRAGDAAMEFVKKRYARYRDHIYKRDTLVGQLVSRCESTFEYLSMLADIRPPLGAGLRRAPSPTGKRWRLSSGERKGASRP